MVKYDDAFHNNFDICVEEMHEEGLEWAYEPSVPIPMDLIASGVEKSRVSLDLPTFMKSFCFWKSLTKMENLPLQSMMRVLPTHHSFCNLTKHGSYVKTQ